MAMIKTMSTPALDAAILTCVARVEWADLINICNGLSDGSFVERTDELRVSRRLQALRKRGHIRYFCGEWRPT
jgi:hypothetical protein